MNYKLVTGWHGQTPFVRVGLAQHCLRSIHFNIWIDNTRQTTQAQGMKQYRKNTDKHSLSVPPR
ncbi:MAG: hypothetical protein IT451_12980 [Candidatus Brocadia sp.]|nr:hypothetical protein [Candidatus Brocadia sp.]